MSHGDPMVRRLPGPHGPASDLARPAGVVAMPALSDDPAGDDPMSAPVVIGTDPGGQFTGVVARQGLRCGDHALIERRGEELADYGEHVGVVALFLAGKYAALGHQVVIACEDLNEPTPHMGMTNLRGFADTAWLIGYLSAVVGYDGRPFVMVPPGGHGSAPLATYPPQLVGERERKGAGRMRHVRSAWDCAGAARTLLRRDAVSAAESAGGDAA